MQLLLSQATFISPLLEAMDNESPDLRSVRTDFAEVLSKLQVWEERFLSEGPLYRLVAPSQLGLSIKSQLLPNLCFDFVDVSHANALTYCWAFCVVCLLQLWKLDSQLSTKKSSQSACTLMQERFATVSSLCTKICQGLPYLLQTEMSLYGSMSAGFPLHMVSESLQTLQLPEYGLAQWCTAIKEQMSSQRISLYEDLAGSGTFS